MSNGRLSSAVETAYKKWLQNYLMQGKLIRREHDFERDVDRKIEDRKRRATT